MEKKSFLQDIRTKLFHPYKGVVMDEQKLTQKYVFNFTWFKVILVCMCSFFIVSVISVLLATQTRLIRLLGPLPKSFVGEDYKNLALRVDSMEYLSEAREKKLLAIQNLITKGVNIAKVEKAEEASVKESVKLVEPSNSSLKISKKTLLPVMSFEKPVTGEITSKYDANRYHYGLDLAARTQSEIKAVASGYILSGGFTRETGYTVWIIHASNYLSSYKHNSKLLVYAGQYVEQGESIAIIGNTGESSTGPHLHFELWRENKPLDPEDVMKF